MPSHSHITEGFIANPYWWDACAPHDDCLAMLPQQADVVIVGAGLTGVEAGRVLASAGRQVLVLDAATPGGGASTRNAGQIGRNFKHSYSQLRATVGTQTAQQYFRELRDAYAAVAVLGSNEGDAIGWRKCGRIVAAMTVPHLRRLHAEYELRALELDEEVECLDTDKIGAELGSGLYMGGVRIAENGVVHPGLYYDYMRRQAEAAGATIVGHAAVTGIEANVRGFAVSTARGKVQCGNVLIATNGYTGAALPWFKSRLVPINAYMVATESLPGEVWKAILPGLRTYHDNRRRSHFITFSPDGTRLLFGGRTGSHPASLKNIWRQLHGDLGFIFPALADVRITHGWIGRCAASRDLFPHVGVNHEGLHYALGYCFSGNAMGPYLARKATALMLGRTEEAHTLFNSATFPKMPMVAKSSWLIPAVMNYYAWADRPKGLARTI